jgi:hypothetical protein
MTSERGKAAMTDAPERIWAWPEPDDGLDDQVDEWGWVYGDWDRSCPEDGVGVQYLLADIAAARIAALEADLARARERVEALERAAIKPAP